MFLGIMWLRVDCGKIGSWEGGLGLVEEGVVLFFFGLVCVGRDGCWMGGMWEVFVGVLWCDVVKLLGVVIVRNGCWCCGG